jgi:glycerol-3-phosphate dehydrogenase (NAD(P)+)
VRDTRGRTLAIIGGGGWGTALAIVLAPRFQQVRLWVYEADLAMRMRATRNNDLYLPGLPVPEPVEILDDLRATVEGAEVVLGVTPSHVARQVWSRMLGWLEPSALFVSATKGLEGGTLLRISEVIAEVVGARFRPRVAVLSGPSFAREVAQGEPTALVVASTDADLAATLQQAFSGPAFRLYTNPDPVGVELGAALKNIVAIGAGVCQGLGLGSNIIAALITRGLVEIRRLAVTLGGRPETLAGLAGLGDLVLTCTGEPSRNRQVGIRLGNGERLTDILSSMRMVAEGIRTTDAALELGRRYGVDLPIAAQVFAILHEQKPPREAVRELMERSLKGE